MPLKNVALKILGRRKKEILQHMLLNYRWNCPGCIATEAWFPTSEEIDIIYVIEISVRASEGDGGNQEGKSTEICQFETIIVI